MYNMEIAKRLASLCHAMMGSASLIGTWDDIRRHLIDSLRQSVFIDCTLQHLSIAFRVEACEHYR